LNRRDGIVALDERVHVVELAYNGLAVFEPDGQCFNVQLGDGTHEDGAVLELDPFDGLIPVRLRKSERCGRNNEQGSEDQNEEGFRSLCKKTFTFCHFHETPPQ